MRCFWSWDKVGGASWLGAANAQLAVSTLKCMGQVTEFTSGVKRPLRKVYFSLWSTMNAARMLVGCKVSRSQDGPSAGLQSARLQRCDISNQKYVYLNERFAARTAPETKPHPFVCLPIYLPLNLRPVDKRRSRYWAIPSLPRSMVDSRQVDGGT